MHVYHGSMGQDTNNATKIEGLWQGLCIAETENLLPLEVEGDSQILRKASIRVQP